MSDKLSHPSCERNKQPILEVLERLLRPPGTVLEVGSGTGQHAVFFAEHLAPMRWQPSEVDEERLASIRAWSAEVELASLLAPLRVDVLDGDWGIGTVEAVFSANMIHIAPWECCLGLLAGARRHLAENGLLILYGPYRMDGAHTAASNRRFDTSLKERDPSWGLRDLEDVCREAEGLELIERVEMPANNQMLVFRRREG